MRLPWEKKGKPGESIEREIRCSSREAAEAESRRQQDREDDPDAEWIFLRDKDRNWVARRSPREPPRRFRQFLGDAILDVFISWP